MDYQDLIDELRDLATWCASDSAKEALYHESADAITALRAEVERLRDLFDTARKLVLVAVAHGMPIDDDVLKVRNHESADATTALRAEVERLRQEQWDNYAKWMGIVGCALTPAQPEVPAIIDHYLRVSQEVGPLRAEVARLRVENAFFRDRLEIISAKMDGEHVWRFSSGWPPFVGPNVDEVMRRVVESLQSGPATTKNDCPL